MRAAIADQDPDIWLFVMFASNATMRHTEITSRRFDEIDWDTCRVAIPSAKAGARAQQITPGLRDALKERHANLRMIRMAGSFPPSVERRQSRIANRLAKQFRRVTIRAKLASPARVTPHLLRHTGISRLLMAGADIKTVQTISERHKTVAMLLHYAHVFVRALHVDQALAVLNRGIPRRDYTGTTHSSRAGLDQARPDTLADIDKKSAA